MRKTLFNGDYSITPKNFLKIVSCKTAEFMHEVPNPKPMSNMFRLEAIGTQLALFPI